MITGERNDERAPALDQINLVVRDMDAMAAFYRRLGLEIDDGVAPWDRHHRTAAMSGGIDLELDSQGSARVWDAGWQEGKVGAILGFRLPSREAVDRSYDELISAGYACQQPPYDAFWGARYAIVEDPDGNAVGLMSPPDPARRAAPPTPDS